MHSGESLCDKQRFVIDSAATLIPVLVLIKSSKMIRKL